MRPGALTQASGLNPHAQLRSSGSPHGPQPWLAVVCMPVPGHRTAPSCPWQPKGSSSESCAFQVSVGSSQINENQPDGLVNFCDSNDNRHQTWHSFGEGWTVNTWGLAGCRCLPQYPNSCVCWHPSSHRPHLSTWTQLCAGEMAWAEHDPHGHDTKCCVCI